MLSVDTAAVDTSLAANYYGNPITGGSTALNMSGQFYTLGTGQLSAISTGVPPEQLTYRLLSLPTNGTIFVGGQALGLKFVNRFGHGGNPPWSIKKPGFFEKPGFWRWARV